MTTKSFSDWLNSYLAERNLRPADLSRLGSIDKGVLSRVLSGERNPAPETLTAIAKALHLPSDEVFRAAGLLPAQKPLDERRSRFETVLEELGDDDVDDLYALAISKLERRQAKQLKPAIK